MTRLEFLELVVQRMEKADPERCSGLSGLLERLVRNAGARSESLHQPLERPQDLYIMSVAIDLEMQFLLGESLFNQHLPVSCGVSDWAMHLISLIVFMCRSDWSDAPRTVLTAMIRPFVNNSNLSL